MYVTHATPPVLTVTPMRPGAATERLTDFSDFRRRRRISEENTVAFTLHRTARNAEQFEALNGHARVNLDSVAYVLADHEREHYGGATEKSVTAEQEIEYGLGAVYQDVSITKTMRINEALENAFRGTGWSFVVVGTFTSREFENFGGASGWRLFLQILGRYDAEYEVSGRTVLVHNRIGRVTDGQLRHGHNLNTLRESINETVVRTYIEGVGALDEDDNPVVTATYTSPNAGKYVDPTTGKRVLLHADKYSNETIYHYDTLLANLKAALQDYPDYNITVTYEELRKNGVKLHDFDIGDYVWVIYEPLDILLQARVLMIEDYPFNPEKSPVIELGNFTWDVKRTVSAQSKVAAKVTNVENAARQSQSIAVRAEVTAKEALAGVGAGSETLTSHVNDNRRHFTDLDRAKLEDAETIDGAQAKATQALTESRSYTDAEIAKLLTDITALTARVKALEDGNTNLPEGGTE
ncbi:phage tail protein [Alkalihalobacillus sp. LMS6]|uniref:phage tail protein n=1 Tax=Alkalihalobacillus sp. LMS6 TaxID=2924034 RepID=UPI0020D09021|nr:phage tail protein [Alkalihalobacillus sp. LMS6]UTR05133.1 phage tail protein [Alkalihalobacillus sp. LMS6]